MKILLLSIFIFFGAGRLSANEGVAFPNSVITIDDLVREFRAQLQLKVEDLGKNYISRFAGTRLEFSSHEPVKCLQKLQPAKSVLAAIDLNQKTAIINDEEELRETATYTGCTNIVALIEEVVTRGKNLKALSFKDFKMGNRQFDLKEGETFRNYKIRNDLRDVIFELTIRKTPNGKYSEWKIHGSRFTTISIDNEELRSHMTYTYYPYKLDYKRKFMHVTRNRDSASWTTKVFAYKKPVGKVIYLSSQNVKISPNSYQTFVNWSTINGSNNSGPIATIKKNLIGYQMWFFPTTEFKSAGTSSQKLLNEFQLINTRLLNNSDINLVKNYVREFLEAIKANQIIDRRPQE